MIRVIYDSEHLRGYLECEFCGKSHPLEGNVRAYRQDGTWRTHPDARLKIYSHFNFDENAHMEECDAISKALRSNGTTWEAVDIASNTVVARGNVVVMRTANTIGPIAVEQTDPKG